MTFVPPPGEIAKGGTYTVEFPAGKGAEPAPARKYEGTYVGSAEVAGKAAHKFTLKYSEPGTTGGMTAETTFHVTQDGTVLQAEGTFKAMPIPAFGVAADGKLKIF